MQNIVEAKKLTLNYNDNSNVINEATFAIKNNDFVFITGKSGSGKSTLLKSMYGAIKVKSGSLSVCLTQMNNIPKKRLEKLRQKLGLIFQDYKLIEEWTVEKNVMLPLLIKGYNDQICKRQAEKILDVVSLTHKSDRFPLELSGGEQQRVAVARALAHNPALFLCDEPTGSLDEYSSSIVWDLLKTAHEQLNSCVIVVTHKIPSNFRFSYRHFEISNGVVYELT